MGKKSSYKNVELRGSAEKRLAKRRTCELPRREDDSQRLLYELQVHQIELETQNAELRRAHAATEAALGLQQQALAEAQRANSAKSRFLAAASHDLRQPLAALSLYVSVLRRKLAPDDAQLVANINTCVTSLSALLSDLLDLSTLDSGAVKPKLRDFAVADLLRKVVSSHAPEAQLKKLSMHFRPSDLTARSDPVWLERLVGNLVANAIRFTPEGGVLIGCRRRFGRTWIEVWDTGIGIREDSLAEIFEEFRQLDNEARGEGKGSGLGLAIVAKTAALLGLQIRVRSRPGRGTLFAVELPVGGPAENFPEATTRTYRPLRIGLVEDRLAVLQALRYALEAAGHQVVAATSSKGLLAGLENRPPDAVISDFRLADGETGFDAITACRTAFGDQLAAIVLTGDTDPELIRSMAERDIVVHHKPLDFEALQAAISASVAPFAVGDAIK